MKNIQPLAHSLLCMLLTLPVAAFAQQLQPDQNAGAQQDPQKPSQQKHTMKNMGADSMKNMVDKMQGMPGMEGMEGAGNQQQPLRPGPPVGSLPRSDGSAGKSYADYGIDMHMDDDPLISKFMLDKLEYIHGDKGDSTVWDGRFRIGHDLNRLWIRSEGQRAHGKTQDADAELLWGHTYAPFWDVVAGVRHDFGAGPSRAWAALGIQGLAPYKFDVEATAYMGQSGRSAVRLKTSYDLLLTQRLILTPEVDANLYGKDDPDRGIGAGLSDVSLGLRLRYEIRREFAPYIGIGFVQKYGKTADISRANGETVHDFQLLAGVRIWL